MLWAALCITANSGCQCLLWVKSGHWSTSASCPLYPRKRTLHCTAENVRFVPKAGIGTYHLICMNNVVRRPRASGKQRLVPFALLSGNALEKLSQSFFTGKFGCFLDLKPLAQNLTPSGLARLLISHLPFGRLSAACYRNEILVQKSYTPGLGLILGFRANANSCAAHSHTAHKRGIELEATDAKYSMFHLGASPCLSIACGGALFRWTKADESGIPSSASKLKRPHSRRFTKGAFHPGARRIWCRHAVGASLSIRYEHLIVSRMLGRGQGTLRQANVRFTPESGHRLARLPRPLCAKLGHRTTPVEIRDRANV
jgi:hypothetical protein